MKDDTSTLTPDGDLAPSDKMELLKRSLPYDLRGRNKGRVDFDRTTFLDRYAAAQRFIRRGTATNYLMVARSTEQT